MKTINKCDFHEQRAITQGSMVQYVAKFDSICDENAKLTGIAINTRSPHIVFESYSNGPSTKDTTNQQRTKCVVGARVIFDG